MLMWRKRLTSSDPEVLTLRLGSYKSKMLNCQQQLASVTSASYSQLGTEASYISLFVDKGKKTRVYLVKEKLN